MSILKTIIIASSFLAHFQFMTAITPAAYSVCENGNCQQIKPRLSIITSVYNGDEFIRGFLEDIVRLPNFSSYELILINANSPGNEEAVINEYSALYPNIIYEKLDYDPGVYGTWNYALKKARADLVTNSNLDDRRNPQSVEKQIQFLEDNEHIDLVYAGYLITYTPNETYENNTFRYSVASDPFEPTKMYLCLPGPQPMWRKSFNAKYGYFREDMKHAGDLELWNRAVLQGATFFRLEDYSTLFYSNPEGLSTSTSPEKASPRASESQFIRGAYGSLWNSAPHSPSILIKLPTRSRPEQFFNQLDAYYKNLSGTVRYHFLITCDEDDPTMNNPEIIKRFSWYPNLTYRFSRNTSKVEAYNRDLELFSDYDILIGASDDLEPVTSGYDRVIVDTMLEHFPDFDGLLNFNDGVVNSIPTYPILGKKFYQRFGYLFHPAYQSLYCDEELGSVARILGKRFESNQVLFKHNHPVWTGGPWDSLYDRNEGLKAIDFATFNERRSYNFYLDETASYQKDWSILICTLDERAASFDKLYAHLMQQITELGLTDKIEVLFFKDNRTHSIGYKRNELLRQSKGKYISFIDDDDRIHPLYVHMIYEKLARDPDVVSLNGLLITQGKTFQKFIHSIDYQHKTRDEQGTYYSPPNHLNAMRRSIAMQFPFAQQNFGEDFDWSMRIARSGLLKKEEKIKESYYFYFYDGKYATV